MPQMTMGNVWWMGVVFQGYMPIWGVQLAQGGALNIGVSHAGGVGADVAAGEIGLASNGTTQVAGNRRKRASTVRCSVGRSFWSCAAQGGPFGYALRFAKLTATRLWWERSLA